MCVLVQLEPLCVKDSILWSYPNIEEFDIMQKSSINSTHFLIKIIARKQKQSLLRWYFKLLIKKRTYRFLFRHLCYLAFDFMKGI